MTCLTSEVPAVDLERTGDVATVFLSGSWRLEDRGRPSWSPPRAASGARRLALAGRGLAGWDSSLALYVLEAERWCARSGVEFAADGLPEALRELVRQVRAAADAPAAPPPGSPGLLDRAEAAARRLLAEDRAAAEFAGECFLSLIGVLRRPRRLRAADVLLHVQQAGAEGLPIIGLVSFLVGTIVAFQAALQLRRFGAEVYVVNFVDILVSRELGPIVVAVILAGRTGAAYAAELGSMAANEELDALETSGISPVDFLVAPRMLALVAVTPLLTLYADALAALGGASVSTIMLAMPFEAFYAASRRALQWSDIRMGLIKSAAFGAIVATCGCLRGLHARRDAAGVGRAATSAVVTSVLWIVLADALFGRLFSLAGP